VLYMNIDKEWVCELRFVMNLKKIDLTWLEHVTKIFLAMVSALSRGEWY
jgi:hypothetical protein